MPYKDVIKQRAYARNHYAKNKVRYIERNSIYRQKLKSYINSIKEKNPCVDCGKKYPYYVMDFDHLYDKKGLIVHFIKANNRNNLEAEIAKCDVVCSNCHRISSHRRLQEVGNRSS